MPAFVKWPPHTCPKNLFNADNFWGQMAPTNPTHTFGMCPLWRQWRFLPIWTVKVNALLNVLTLHLLSEMKVTTCGLLNQQTKISFLLHWLQKRRPLTKTHSSRSILSSLWQLCKEQFLMRATFVPAVNKFVHWCFLSVMKGCPGYQLHPLSTRTLRQREVKTVFLKPLHHRCGGLKKELTWHGGRWTDGGLRRQRRRLCDSISPRGPKMSLTRVRAWKPLSVNCEQPATSSVFNSWHPWPAKPHKRHGNKDAWSA